MLQFTPVPNLSCPIQPFLSPEADISSKRLDYGHLVVYHSVNMAAAEVFHVSPPTATTQNSMDRKHGQKDAMVILDFVF
jgi:hypothetical protein